MSDYHAFKSTSGGSGGGGGCSFRVIIIIAVIFELLTLLGQCHYG